MVYISSKPQPMSTGCIKFLATVFFLEFLIASIATIVIGGICVDSSPASWCPNHGISIALILIGIGCTLLFIAIIALIHLKKW